jgi:hypothetical protein
MTRANILTPRSLAFRIEDDPVNVVLDFLRSQSRPLALRYQSPVFAASRPPAAILANNGGRNTQFQKDGNRSSLCRAILGEKFRRDFSDMSPLGDELVSDAPVLAASTDTAGCREGDHRGSWSVAV